MDQEAQRAAEERAVEEAKALLAEQAREAEDRKGEDVVAQHRLPAPGVCAVQKQLQQAEREGREHARPEAPAGAEQEDRQHRQRDRAALRQLIELEIPEDLRKRDHDGRFAQAAKRQLGFFHKKSLQK